MRCILVLLSLVFTTTFLPSLTKARSGPVLLRYTVDATHSAKRFLKIRVQIEGLREGHTAIVLPSKPDALSRFSHVSRMSENGEVSSLTQEDGQVVVESPGDGRLTLVFQLHGESFQHLGRATYLDEYRCLFHPEDVLLHIENQEPKVTVSFIMSDHWEAMSSMPSAVDGTFEIETERPVPFYLGRAETTREGGGGSLSMAIEPGWPPTPVLLAALRQQVQYRQKFGGNSGFSPLLAVFLAPTRPVANKELLAVGTTRLLAFTAVPGLSEAPSALRHIQLAMARGLVRKHYPVVAGLSAATGPDRLIDYLALKACFKTGVLGRTEFLDALAVELWNTFGEAAEPPTKPSPDATTSRLITRSPSRSRLSGLLLDLALSFYGITTRSLDGFLGTVFTSSTTEPVTEADFRRKLRQEPQALAALTGIWRSEDTQSIGELLRPFGLLFDRRELPAFDFQLNEMFQIVQLAKPAQGTTTLEMGDRILSINNHRLVLPDDLLKCRSRLTPGQEVQLDVERRNVLLRVTQRVAGELLLKLEVNKLADADKQTKLEQFLSAESG